MQRKTKRARATRKKSVIITNVNTPSVENTETQNTEVQKEPVQNQIKERPKRIPIGTRDVLKYPQRPGYVRYVFNDDPNKPGNMIQIAKEAGWEIVENENGEHGVDGKAGKATRIGSTTSIPVGGGVTGVLMEIPEEWYKEDQKLKQRKVDRTEEGLRQKKVKAEDAGDDGMYGEIVIKTNR